MGLVTDADARVLRDDGQPIPGLYAVGNDAQSIMGGVYPGPGITIGPAITFGYSHPLMGPRRSVRVDHRIGASPAPLNAPTVSRRPGNGNVGRTVNRADRCSSSSASGRRWNDTMMSAKSRWGRMCSAASVSRRRSSSTTSRGE